MQKSELVNKIEASRAKMAGTRFKTKFSAVGKRSDGTAVILAARSYHV